MPRMRISKKENEEKLAAGKSFMASMKEQGELASNLKGGGKKPTLKQNVKRVLSTAEYIKKRRKEKYGI